MLFNVVHFIYLLLNVVVILRKITFVICEHILHLVVIQNRGSMICCCFKETFPLFVVLLLPL